METNGKNRFASQGVSIAQMMYVSKYKSHKIALFNSMKKSNIAPISMMLFLRNFERFDNLHSYHGRVGGNQRPPISLLLPRMTGRNMRPPVIYFPNWPPLRLRWAHYFRMRDHGSSLFSAVKNLHLSSLSFHIYVLVYDPARSVACA